MRTSQKTTTSNGWNLLAHIEEGQYLEVYGNRGAQVVSFVGGRVALHQWYPRREQSPYLDCIMRDTFKGCPVKAALEMTANHPDLK